MRDRRPKRHVTSPARNVSWGMVCLFFCLFIFEVLTLATDYNSTKPLCQSRGPSVPRRPSIVVNVSWPTSCFFLHSFFRY
jgi:hypothetical protein